MLKWIADWWRFLLISMAIGAIAAVAKRFLDGWIADSVVTFISLIGGANMIFDLIGRRSWEQRLQEKDREKDREISSRDQLLIERDREIAEQHREIAERDREIAERHREIAERDQQIAAQNQEIADLRHQAELARELAERDLRIATQGQEISDLRQQVQELRQRFNGQPEDHLPENHSEE